MHLRTVKLAALSGCSAEVWICVLCVRGKKPSAVSAAEFSLLLRSVLAFVQKLTLDHCYYTEQ